MNYFCRNAFASVGELSIVTQCLFIDGLMRQKKSRSSSEPVAPPLLVSGTITPRRAGYRSGSSDSCQNLAET